MSKDEISQELIKSKYSFLTDEDIRFVMDHQKNYGYKPLFYMIYRFMVESKERNNQVYNMLYGIGNGRRHPVKEVAQHMNLTRERVRQISRRPPIDIHIATLFNNEEWVQYVELLQLPFITEDTDGYRQIIAREHLNTDFLQFAALLQLIRFMYNEKQQAAQPDSSDEAEQVMVRYEIEIVDDMVVVINRAELPSIKLRNCVKSLDALINSRHANATKIDVREALEDLDEAEETKAVKLMAYIAEKALGGEIDSKGQVWARKNYIDVSDDMYTILEKNGSPMSLDELLMAFKQRYPNHKYTDAGKLRHYLYKHPHIKCIGNTSCYGLDSWDDVFYGSIRDLLFKVLDEADGPLNLDQLYQSVKIHYPDTNPTSLDLSMKLDTLDRFEVFEDGYFGLKKKHYSSDYVVHEPVRHPRRRMSFEEKIAELCSFVDTHHRLPVALSKKDETAIYQWMNSILSGYRTVAPAYKKMLDDVLKRYEQAYVPRNLIEFRFLTKSKEYMAYVDEHSALPSEATHPELHHWMTLVKAKHQTFQDHRLHYMEQLVSYVNSKGLDCGL